MDNFEQMTEFVDTINADLYHLSLGNNSKDILNDIKANLNSLFKGANCANVVLTNNTDKLLFGIIVMPIFSTEDIVSIMTDDEDDHLLITKYKVEIDSKLFSPLYGLTNDEITALLVHEVAALVSNKEPLENARYLIDCFCTENDTTIKISTFASYIELLSYCIKEAARRSVSVFEKDYFLPLSIDEALNLQDLIYSAQDKLRITSNMTNTDIDNKLIIVKWVLGLYRNILKYRIYAIHKLEKGIAITGSKFEIQEMQNIISRLKRIDDSELLQHESANSWFKDSSKSSISALQRFKANGVKNYYDDFYEIEFEINNLDDDRGAAIMLMHKINSRMSVIDDYLSTEEGLNDITVKRLLDLYNKYDTLRTKLASSKLKSPRTLLIDYGDD